MSPKAWRGRPVLKYLDYEHPAFPHGPTGQRYGCRCSVCVDGYSRYQAEGRRRRGEVPADSEYVPRRVRAAKGHGTRYCYQKGCRLPECVQANRDYSREMQTLYDRGLTMTDRPDRRRDVAQ